jgi:allantoicase
MGEGWETRRRRAGGNEWLAVRFAGQAVVSLVEVDTSGYIGNSPGMAEVRGFTGPGVPDGGWDDPSGWGPLLPRTALRPDTPHRFRVSAAPCEVVRLDVLPDGGVARLRLYGSLTPEGLARVRSRWAQTAP